MLDDVLETLREIVDNDEFFELMAKATKRTRDALIAEGFAYDEAMQITIAKAGAK